MTDEMQNDQRVIFMARFEARYNLGMRFLAGAFILVAAVIGAWAALPLCPHGRSATPAPAVKARQCLTVVSVGAVIGGGLAALPIALIRLASSKRH